jgi:hypothetical protein
MSEPDIVQTRFDAATPPLDGTYTIVQSFICQYPHLYQVELLPAVYEIPGRGTLTFSLSSYEAGELRVLARLMVDAEQIRHNVPLQFAFEPQPDSASRAYELKIEGSTGVRVGFWYNSANAYGDGELSLGDSDNPGDLHFRTHCRYDPLTVLGQAGTVWGRFTDTKADAFAVVIALLLLLLVPGYLVWHALDLAQSDQPILNLAMSLAISLSLVPVGLQWNTVFGLRWNRGIVVVAYSLLVLGALLRLLRSQFADLAPWRAGQNRVMVTAVLGLVILSVVLRFIQARNLVLPAWVDSPQHALITELVALHGTVPQSYEPLLSADSFVFHFGFHADTAVFHWLSGLPIPQAMLLLGQVLNGASTLMAYLFALRLTGRRVAALVAGLVTGVVSYMPAYYVSWGRYTLLTGLLLLPAAAVLALSWMEAEHRDYRLLLLAALLQAGLFLTHARAAIFGACFLLAYLLCESIAHWRQGQSAVNGELWRRTAFLSLLALGLSGPWIVQLVMVIRSVLSATGRTLRGDPTYNAVPRALLFVARNRELMGLGVVGAVWGLFRRRRETVWVLSWCALVAVVVNPSVLGLPTSSLLNNVTAIIALFVPLSVLAGQAIAALWDVGPTFVSWLGNHLGFERDRAATVVTRVTLSLLVLGIGVYSAWGMVSIVNPVTVLATAEDLQAMEWIKGNTPVDAVFLINARLWQLETYVGTDGGYWIRRLTGRRALLPELPYVYGTPQDVRHINEMAQVVAELDDASDHRLRDIVAEEQVTHVYVGAKGGPLTPQMFLGSEDYRVVYNTGAVWIFEVAREFGNKNKAAPVIQALPCGENQIREDRLRLSGL